MSPWQKTMVETTTAKITKLEKTFLIVPLYITQVNKIKRLDFIGLY